MSDPGRRPNDVFRPRFGRRRTATPALALVVAAGLLVAMPTAASAATFTVTKTADTNDGTCNADCSLREAIGAANAAAGADTITLPAGTYQLTLANAGGTNEDNNATGDLDINGGLTINGAGSGSTIIEAGTTTSNGIDKVIAINPICTTAFDATITGVTVRFGRNTQPSGAADFSFTGGGIDWCATGAGSTFTLSNSVVSDNTNVNGYGGGLNIDTNGPVTVPTTVNITNDTFQNNTTLSATQTANGGAINIFGAEPTVNVTTSTFTSNSTTNPTSGGGAIYYRPTTLGSLTISGSTFTSNTAAGIGGAIATDAHGAGTTVTISGSTFTTNHATNSFGGALDLDATNLNTTPFSLSHLKITGNTAGQAGGGLFVGAANVNMSKSLIVGNTATTASGLRKSVDAATATVAGNWWGCSTGPSAAPCDTASTAGGTLNFTPWYRDRLTAAPSPIVTNQSTALTASFLSDSSSNAVPLADLAEIIGRSVTWAATNGNLSGQQATVQAAGTATASFQATAAGTAVISAKVDNDNTAPTSSNVLSLTVSKADTTSAITSDLPDPSVTNQGVTVQYTVTGAQGNSPTAPTGNVTVSDGTDSCTATVGAGQCTIKFSSVGAKSLTATYAGDVNFNASPASASVSHQVDKADTTTTITADNPDPSVTGQGVTVQYTVTGAQGSSPTAPTGNVTVSDGTQSCTATAAAGQCSIAFASAGARSLTATYAGDTNFNGSASTPATAHQVNKADTGATISSDLPDPSDIGQAVTVHYTVVATAPGSGTPTGNVTVSDGVNSCTATVAAAQCDVSLTTSGPRTLTATYAGDANFNGATSPGVSHTVNPPPGTDLSVSASHTPEPVKIGEQVTLQVQLDNNGAADAATVTLSDALPASMTFLSASLPGWSCTTPPVGSTGTVSCTKATFANGGSVALSIVARTTMSGSFDHAAQVTSTTNDTSPGDEADTDSVTVSPNARGCTIVGTPGADVIDGTSGPDVICGWGGADQIDGKGGADRILGQGGADGLTGGAGADTLLGGGGNDTLHAVDGLANDVVDGQSGTDSCTADPGDTLQHCP